MHRCFVSCFVPFSSVIFWTGSRVYGHYLHTRLSTKRARAHLDDIIHNKTIYHHRYSTLSWNGICVSGALRFKFYRRVISIKKKNKKKLVAGPRNVLATGFETLFRPEQRERAIYRRCIIIGYRLSIFVNKYYNL